MPASSIPHVSTFHGNAETAVEVYRNLHKRTSTGGPVYSVRDTRTKRVIAHAETVHLVDVRFKVSAAGNARVRREHAKNVHAVVVGSPAQARPASALVDAYYNPYTVTTFVDRKTGEPVHVASYAVIDAKGVHYEP